MHVGGGGLSRDRQAGRGFLDDVAADRAEAAFAMIRLGNLRMEGVWNSRMADLRAGAAARRRIVSDRADSQAVIHLPPGGGRSYALGAITAVFKADEAETGARYSVRNGGWSRTPRGRAPTRTKPTTRSSTSSREWPASSRARPGCKRRRGASCASRRGRCTTSRTAAPRAWGSLNVFIPGGFERNMPAIVEWFAGNRQPTCSSGRARPRRRGRRRWPARGGTRRRGARRR